MVLQISTEDCVVGYGAYRSLLGTLWQGIGRSISTGDGMVGYGFVDPYWGRC